MIYMIVYDGVSEWFDSVTEFNIFIKKMHDAYAKPLASGAENNQITTGD